MPLDEFHVRLGSTSFLYFFAISLWGYFRFFRGKGISSSYWGALAVGEILLAAQGIVGAILWFGGPGPSRPIHILYGFVALIMIPGAYVYTKGRTDRAEILMYGTATIITVGLLFRGTCTGWDPSPCRLFF